MARGDYESIALEDDRTLRLEDVDGYAYVDRRPGPEPDCGGRGRFRPVFESAEVIVTEAAYGHPEEAD